MKKSALQQARATYQPKLPYALTGAVKMVEGKPTQSVANQEEIKALFPNTYGLPEITFEKTNPTVGKPLNVGVILSGGQAPGGHNVICGLFDGIKKINKESRLYGFLMGPGGFVDHQYMELTSDIIDEYRNTGGFDIIGSGRTKLETKEQFDKGLEILKQLDITALVIIGGDDSNTNAAILAEYYKAIGAGVQVIGCPKTIDGDLKNELIETSFGFDTATKVYSEVIGNIQRDCNVQVSLIETEKLLGEMVGKRLAEMKAEGKYTGKFGSQYHFFGYEGRCADPSNFDADYCYALGYNAAMLINAGVTGYMSSVRNLVAPSVQWFAGGIPITMMMNMERRHGEMKPVIQKALVDLNGTPFLRFTAKREQWAQDTCYMYPGPIQYFGPAEVCDQCTATLRYEHLDK